MERANLKSHNRQSWINGHNSKVSFTFPNMRF